jgi:sugar O-acyltransferase (sialic acid O-acetyltransferase NeuD family)
MARKRIVVIGAGGMAREMAALIQAKNRVHREMEFCGFIVSDFGLLGPHDSKEGILGDYEWLAANRAAVDAIGVGIGSPPVRLKVVQELRGIAPDVEWPVLIHPSAELDFESANLAEGAFIGAGVVGTVNVTLEPFALCNFGCTLGHEATVGSGSVVSPGANVNGGVKIGSAVLIGTGAQILQYLTIGDGAIVGAGAVVTKDVHPGVTVLGVPAKPVQTKSPL